MTLAARLLEYISAQAQTERGQERRRDKVGQQHVYAGREFCRNLTFATIATSISRSAAVSGFAA